MTDKQVERVKNKIKKLKKALADDKKFWGGEHHDGAAIRYALPAQYIKIKDYKGGLRYLRWFDRTFSDDSGFPIFLFEWTFILYKTNKLDEAEKKAHRTFFSNTYLLDKFLEKEQLQFDKSELMGWEYQSLAQHLPYKKDDIEFIEFAAWLNQILNSIDFLDKANRFFKIEQQLMDERGGPERSKLVEESFKIRYG